MGFRRSPERSSGPIVMIFMNYYGSYPMLNSIDMVCVSHVCPTRFGSLFHSILARAAIVTTARPRKNKVITGDILIFVSRFFRYSLKNQGNFRRYFNFLPVNTNANTKADTSENARKYKCKYKLTILPVNTHVNTGKSRGKPLGKSLGKPLGKSLGRSLQKGYHGF